MSNLGKYWKGALGFLTPGVVALGVAVQDSSDGGSVVTRIELIGILAAMVATGGLVTAKGNAETD